MGAPRFVMDDFWPSDLFLGGIPGAWYDPTDLSTMFQDSAGTTPVTAVEQPVGLILDKSQGLALGAELVTNGDFSNGSTGWIASNASWSVGGGKASNDGTNVVFASFRQNNVVTAGTFYLVEWDQVTTAGDLRLWFNGVQLVAQNISGTGRKSYRVQCTSTGSLFFEANIGAVLSIDNVTVRTLAGNHASQSTAASRPTYRARYNLLTFSEELNNGVWNAAMFGNWINPVVTPNAAIAPDGTLTADQYTLTSTIAAKQQRVSVIAGATYTASIWVRGNAGNTYGSNGIVLRIATGNSGAVVNPDAATTRVDTSISNTAWTRFTVSLTIPGSGVNQIEIGVGGGNGGTAPNCTIDVWGAQLLTAADVTATGNAYQRIAAATVYDTAPIFRPYLAFDGMDDSLSTAAINFTSTDKMSVFFGLSKLSDAPFGCALELSTSAPSSAGAFLTFARGSTFATGFDQGYGGTVWNGAPGVNAPAPTTRVFSQLYNIAQPSAIIRGNGAQVYADNITAGGGTFGNYPLFIGRRNNASFPFNGRIYELIVRGAASSTTEIIDTETWVNARTGGY